MLEWAMRQPGGKQYGQKGLERMKLALRLEQMRFRDKDKEQQEQKHEEAEWRGWPEYDRLSIQDSGVTQRFRTDEVWVGWRD